MYKYILYYSKIFGNKFGDPSFGLVNYIQRQLSSVKFDPVLKEPVQKISG